MSRPDAIVIAAMEEEIAPFLARADRVDEERRIGNAVLRAIQLHGRDVLLVRGGIGLVNAAGAATTAILSSDAAADSDSTPLIISAGSAGGIGTDVSVGDVVVGVDNINVDADARAFGYPLGQVPGMPLSYPGEATVLNLVPTLQIDWSDAPLRLHTGLHVSSYSFVTPERAVTIATDFPGVLATDMESSAIAQTAHAHGLPFVSIRGISDLCGAAEFDAHVDDAADRSAAVIAELLTRR